METTNVLNYNYDAIKYFLSVASHGSLLRAAKSLGISQSALSQSMKNLEQSLGVVLFNRNTRGIVLTEAGRVLYEKAFVGNESFKNAIIETLRMKSFAKMKSFKISISSSLTSLIIAPKILKLQKQFDTNIKFCKHIYQQDVVHLLQTGDFDLVILKENCDFIIKEVEVKKLCEFNYVFVYNPDFFKMSNHVKAEDLENIPIVMKERSGRNDNSWIKYSFDKFIECRNDNQCLEMIKNGAGIGVFPKEFALQQGLKILDVEGISATKRVVYACYLPSNLVAKRFVKELLK